MKVYSEPGRGSTFKLLFPAATGPAEAAPESHAASTGWRGHGTVLVVDDEQAVRATVAPMLAAMGLESVLTNDGQDGVELFRADPGQFSLVLLDLTMPRMDGAEAFAELRKLRPGMPVVLMSGFNEQEALVRFAGKGIASFIQKPFAFDSLRTVIRSVLG
jgi:DNA-binding NtrC family response regulator